MSLFKKIFGSKSNKSEEELKPNERSKYIPEIKLPVDEMFTTNFKANGGKFLYCENLDEVFETLSNIIKENNWEAKNGLFFDKQLKAKFKKANITVSESINDSTFFITTCENLIANDGSLLISSNQIAEKKLIDLPSNFIVFATTSQMVETISEGLRLIKSKSTKRIPTNITTIKHFKSSDEKDFLSYGCSCKNLYLLLLEDL